MARVVVDFTNTGQEENIYLSVNKSENQDARNIYILIQVKRRDIMKVVFTKTEEAVEKADVCRMEDTLHVLYNGMYHVSACIEFSGNDIPGEIKVTWCCIDDTNACKQKTLTVRSLLTHKIIASPNIEDSTHITDACNYLVKSKDIWTETGWEILEEAVCLHLTERMKRKMPDGELGDTNMWKICKANSKLQSKIGEAMTQKTVDDCLAKLAGDKRHQKQEDSNNADHTKFDVTPQKCDIRSPMSSAKNIEHTTELLFDAKIPADTTCTVIKLKSGTEPPIMFKGFKHTIVNFSDKFLFLDAAGVYFVYTNIIDGYNPVHKASVSILKQHMEKLLLYVLEWSRELRNGYPQDATDKVQKLIEHGAVKWTPEFKAILVQQVWNVELLGKSESSWDHAQKMMVNSYKVKDLEEDLKKI